MTTKPKSITLNTVKSSNIDAIGHHGDTLAVRFKGSGTTYHYHGVTGADFDQLSKAESIGSHFAKHIRNSFKSTKLESK